METPLTSPYHMYKSTYLPFTYTYPLLSSYILHFQKAFLLPKANHSTYRQDPCPFHLLRNLSHKHLYVLKVSSTSKTKQKNSFVPTSHLWLLLFTAKLPKTIVNKLSFRICFPTLSSTYFNQSWIQAHHSP